MYNYDTDSNTNHNGTSAVQLGHLRSVAYSALNKPQIYGGPAKLHCYHHNLR